MKIACAFTIHIARCPQVVGELVVAFAETLGQCLEGTFVVTYFVWRTCSFFSIGLTADCTWLTCCSFLIYVLRSPARRREMWWHSSASSTAAFSFACMAS